MATNNQVTTSVIEARMSLDAPTINCWSMHIDAETKRPYWFCAVTNEASWERPVESAIVFVSRVVTETQIPACCIADRDETGRLFYLDVRTRERSYVPSPQWPASGTESRPVATLNSGHQFQSDSQAICIICFGCFAVDQLVTCRSLHSACSECLSNYILKTWDEKQHLPAVPLLTCCFPDCTREIGVRAVARLASEEAFERFEHHRQLRERALAVQDLEAKLHSARGETGKPKRKYKQAADPSKEELLFEELLKVTLGSKAKMCPRCHVGPVDFFGCNDLRAHHCEYKTRGQVDNSCKGCGFFSNRIEDWMSWDGKLRRPREKPTIRQRQTLTLAEQVVVKAGGSQDVAERIVTKVQEEVREGDVVQIAVGRMQLNRELLTRLHVSEEEQEEEEEFRSLARVEAVAVAIEQREVHQLSLMSRPERSCTFTPRFVYNNRHVRKAEVLERLEVPQFDPDDDDAFSDDSDWSYPS